MNFRLHMSIIFILLSFPIQLSYGNEDIKKVFLHMKNKEWEIATKAAKLTGDDALIKIVLSQKFLDSNYLNNSFEQVIEFIEKNPHWPEINKLKKQAESYLNQTTNKSLIMKWFNNNKPQTSNGYRYYALSAAQTEQDTKTIDIIKTGLLYGDFTLAEEKKFFSNYKKFITEKDYVERINEYLWKKQPELAKKLLNLVNTEYTKTFNACNAAINNSSTKEELFRKVNPKYYISSLLYHYLKSNKSSKPTTNSIKLFSMVKNDFAHADDWGILQLYYAREFLDYKEFSNSYKVISSHFASNPETMREAEWLAGWLALQHLKNPSSALIHFKKFSQDAKRPISKARGDYWLGRTYAALKNNKLSTEYYNKAAKYSYTFYGQLSSIELGHNTLILPSSTKVDESHHERFETDEVIKAAKLWVEYGSFEMAHLYGKAAMEKAKTPGEAVLIAHYIIDNCKCEVWQRVMIAKEASYQGAFIKEYAYPTPYSLKNTPIDPAFAYAIMRQESLFHPSLTSSAGAMGVMQLIKTTACGEAKAIGITCDVSKLLKDPDYNILLGTNHLKHLLKYRNGSNILAIASYNADPKKVDRWVNLFGDPRKMHNLHKIIDWIELIPFSETRNYVQRVMEGMQVYRTILNNSNNLALKKDLISNKL